MFINYYLRAAPLKREILKIKCVMADKDMWDKLDKFSDRLTKMEIKLARMEGRMALAFTVLGVGIQLVFKYVLT